MLRHQFRTASMHRLGRNKIVCFALGAQVVSFAPKRAIRKVIVKGEYDNPIVS